MHLILTGATGLVGTAVLDAMVRAKDVTKISVISRRPLKLTDDRINVILHKDFETYDKELLQKLEGAQGCVWALGISQTQVNKEDYVKITKTYALAAAEAFKDLTHTTKTKEPFHFVYVSGDGSTFKPGLFTPIFGRVKGETELALAEMQRQNPTTLKASTVRPSFVDWTGHEEIKPYLPEIGAAKNTFATLLSPVAKYAIKGRWSPTGPLGRFLTGMATNMWEGALDGEGVERLPGGFTVVDNPAMWRVLDQEAAGKK